MHDQVDSVGEAGTATSSVRRWRSTPDRRFGDLVRQARERKKWSQRQLAEVLAVAELKLDPTAITRIERGTRDVKLGEATVIASVLGIDLGKALTEIPISHDQQFRMGVTAVATAAVQARRMLVQALDEVRHMMLDKIDEETLERMSKEAGFSGMAELTSALIRQECDREEAHTMRSHALSDRDRHVKQAVIDAVIDEVLPEGVFPF